MATLFDEVDSYLTNIKQAIDFVLVRDVAPAVVDRIENSAETNVYAAYEPSQYYRRMSLNQDNAYDRSASNLTLTIENMTTGNASQIGEGYDPGQIGDIIESGVGYHWHNSRIYRNIQPRPWMENGLEDAIRDRSADRALESGLLSLGF